jgi:predicted homoserine dehydrogenase-like protein
VVGVAKRPLSTGTLIEHGLGGFDLRGEAVEIEGHEDAVPITLLDGARLTRPLEPGEVVRKADVELPETLASRLYAEALEGHREMVSKPI